MLIHFDSWCASQSSTLSVWSRKNQSIFSCVHASLTFYFPISLVSLWNADATWGMFEWNSALTLSRSSINFIGFFISRESRDSVTGERALNEFFLFFASISFTNTAMNDFWWSFLDTRFLPCRLAQRVKIISSAVRQTDISVKSYLNNIF